MDTCTLLILSINTETGYYSVDEQKKITNSHTINRLDDYADVVPISLSPDIDRRSRVSYQGAVTIATQLGVVATSLLVDPRHPAIHADNFIHPLSTSH